MGVTTDIITDNFQRNVGDFFNVFFFDSPFKNGLVIKFLASMRKKKIFYTDYLHHDQSFAHYFI